MESENSSAGPAFNVIDPGHSYDLANYGGVGDPQHLNFIKKELAEGQAEGTLETVQNGTITETVISVLIDRLKFLDAKLPSSFTKDAIAGLDAALLALQSRTSDRMARGVEGTKKE